MSHHGSLIPALVFVGTLAWFLLSPLLALGFACALRRLGPRDPFAWCDPLSFAGLDE